jgi:hypothetical protein
METNNLLFDIPEKSKYTCRNCKNAQGWQSGGSVIYYCAVRKSNRTENKLLKIKLKNPSCLSFILE